jgi:hypothetical protein
MRRVLAALLSVLFIVMAAGYARDGHWLPAVAIVVLGGWSVWYFDRGPVPQAAPMELTGDLATRVARLVDSGRQMEAIRLVRRETGAGLVAASRAVNHLSTTTSRGDATDDQDDTRPS